MNRLFSGGAHAQIRERTAIVRFPRDERITRAFSADVADG